MGKYKIIQLISKKILGCITSFERNELDSELEEAPSRKAVYETLMEERSLHARYRHWRSINEDAAWHRFSALHFGDSRIVTRRWMGVAAAAIVLLVAISGWVYYKSRPVLPVMAQNEAVAERTSAERGKQMALLSIKGRWVEINDSQTYINAVEADDIDEGQPVELSTEDGKEFWVTLSDGTIVHLNYGSKLTYAAKFGEGSRDVSLEGEAYFKVAHRENVPFRVLTPNGTVVKDIGTAFNVNTRAADGATQVVLVEGKAEVSFGNTVKEILPGQSAVTKERNSAILLSQIDVTPFVSWHEGRFVFTNCPLDELMNVVIHWYGGNVKIIDPADKNIKFSGVIDRYANLQSIMYAISSATGLEIRMLDKYIIIGNKND